MQTSFHWNLQQEKLGNLVGDILDRTSSHCCGTNQWSACPDVFENLLIRLLKKRLSYKGDLRNPKSLVNPWFSHSQPSKKLLTSLTFLTLSPIVVKTWWPGRPWRLTASCPVPGRLGSSGHLRAKVRRLSPPPPTSSSDRTNPKEATCCRTNFYRSWWCCDSGYPSTI